MWQLTRLYAQNFSSFEELDLTFQQGKVTMISGINRDEPNGANSNGSGKSAILDAIRMGITDQVAKGQNKDDYIRWGQKESFLVVELYNTLLSQKMRIERLYKMKGASKAKLFLDGVHQSQLTSINHINKEIIELFDISREDLLNFFLISQENQHSFFESNDSNKKSIISRFTGLDLLDQVQEKIKIDKAEKELFLDVLKGEIHQDIINIATYKKAIEKLKEGNREAKSRTVERLKSKYSKIEASINRLIDDLKSNKTIVEEIEDFLKDKVVENVDKREEKVERLRRKWSVLKDEVSEAKGLLIEIKANEKTIVVCPSCQHKFSTVDKSIDPETLEEAKKDVIELIEVKKEEIDDVSEKLTSLKSKIRSLKEKNKIVESKKNRLDNVLEKVDYQVETLGEKRKELDDLIEEMKRAEEEVNEVDNEGIAELRKMIKECEKEKKRKEKSLRKGKREISDIIFWHENMGKKGFKTWLSNKVLKILEAKINRKIQEYKINLFLKIEGFKVLKTGDVREQITTTISKDGIYWRKFARLSGGQKMRVSLVGIDVIQNMINDKSSSGGFDFCALDETFDGLDQTGQKLAIELLERTGKTIVFISHQQNDIVYPNEITVEYFGGKSKILWE